MSTPLATCLRACSAFPASAATSMPRSWALAITSGGGGPSAFALLRAGVHPVQGHLQLVRVVEADAAEHAEAACPAHRRGDVLRRGEADDGMLDAEQVAQVGAHRRAHGFPGFALAD